MRRGEYFPLYRASQLGGRRTKPFTRPTHDSLPAFQCGVRDCGTSRPYDRALPYELIIWIDSERTRNFCSLGCLSRWAITQELRQP